MTGATHGESQVGAHGLRHRHPVAAARSLHHLVILIEEHRNGVGVIGLDLFARAVVGVVDPVGARESPTASPRENSRPP